MWSISFVSIIISFISFRVGVIDVRYFKHVFFRVIQASMYLIQLIPRRVVSKQALILLV